MTDQSSGDHQRVDRDGVSYTTRILGTTFAPLFCFFLAAGRLEIVAGWIYFAVLVAFGILNVALLAVGDPDLLNARGRTETDVVKSDRIVVGLYLVFTHVAAPIAAGLQYRFRIHPGPAGTVPTVVGVAVLAAGALLENLATCSNHHYERNIRLQTNRDHAVVTTGPYAVIRHPGYLAYILKFAALPVALVSVWAVVPILLGVVSLIVRTAMEDRVLVKGLPGYADYAACVRFRLIPGVW